MTSLGLLLKLHEQGLIGRLADQLMKPLMYWLQGNYHESPQETHFWNNIKFTFNESQHLDQGKMTTVPGDTLALKRRTLGFVPIFHMPRFGGWTKYSVLQPKEKLNEKWFIGWMTGDACGVSIIPLRTPVRVLSGPAECHFFGLLLSGQQIELAPLGTGQIGKLSLYGNIPLR